MITAGMSQEVPSSRKVRILVAKPGLDGHDRGAKVVARALRDAGFEVIYTGLHQTPEMIANAVVQEDVDGVGLSIMSGAHNTLFPAVIEALRARGAGDIPVFGGGIVPDEDVSRLEAAGVRRVFPPATPLAEIVAWVRENVAR
jgi:methylmalonyl-CoA mutase, C-terminal domain